MAKIVIDVNNECVDWVLKAYPNISLKFPEIVSWKTIKPTLSKLKRLSKEILRPIAFFLSSPKTDPKSVGQIDKIDTRTIESEKIDIDYKIVVLSEELLNKRSKYIEIASFVAEDFQPKFKTFESDDKNKTIEYIANNIYPDEDKLKSLSIKELHEHLISKIEGLNILVFRMQERVASLRGMAIYNDVLPIIAVSSGDSVVGQIFTLIHELAHVLLKSSMVHNSNILNYGHSSIEKICNEISGKVLLKTDSIYSDPEISSLRNVTIELPNIEAVAIKYKISRDVVLRRLLMEKFITKERYDVLLHELKEKRKSEKSKKRSIAGKELHLFTTINKLGMSYCRVVYKGYSKGFISKYDLSNYLGRKDKYCVQIMNKIASRVSLR